MKLEARLSSLKTKATKTRMHWVSEKASPAVARSVVVTQGSDELELQH